MRGLWHFQTSYDVTLMKKVILISGLNLGQMDYELQKNLSTIWLSAIP